MLPVYSFVSNWDYRRLYCIFFKFFTPKNFMTLPFYQNVKLGPPYSMFFIYISWHFISLDIKLYIIKFKSHSYWITFSINLSENS